MKVEKSRAPILLAGALIAAIAVNARAGEIRVACYSDGNECEVTQDLAKRFEAQNPDVKVVIDKVPYKAIVEQLPVQLAAGEGPDIARVTDLGGLTKYYLDITPYVKDPKYWEANFGQTLTWLRPVADRQGHLRHDDAAHRHRAVRQQDAVRAGQGAAARRRRRRGTTGSTRRGKVAKATQVPFAMAFDRSGHRFAGAAISQGAKIFDAKRQPGRSTTATRRWRRNSTTGTATARCRRKSGAASAARPIATRSRNSPTAASCCICPGSWQISRMETQIGKNFDWIAVPDPCGPGGCTGMPGGAAFVALKRTKNPKDVGRFLDFLASEPVYAEYMVTHREHSRRTPRSRRRASTTRSRQPPRRRSTSSSATSASSRRSPTRSRATSSTARSSIRRPRVSARRSPGEMSLDDALKRISADIDEQVKAAAQVAPPSPRRWRSAQVVADSVLETLRAGVADARRRCPRTRIEVPMRALQRALGVPRIGWVFVAPNLRRSSGCSRSCRSSSISTTRSPAARSSIRPQRPFTGLDNLADAVRLRRTTSIRRAAARICSGAPSTTPRGSPLLQVGADGARSALVTALVLNRKIIGRGFLRGVFFFPVLLSPVVVALIWKWILQREGCSTRSRSGAGVTGDCVAHDARLGVLLERVRQHLGAHGLLHADPARRPAGDPRRPLRSRGDGPRIALARASRASRCRC